MTKRQQYIYLYPIDLVVILTRSGFTAYGGRELGSGRGGGGGGGRGSAGSACARRRARSAGRDAAGARLSAAARAQAAPQAGLRALRRVSTHFVLYGTTISINVTRDYCFYLVINIYRYIGSHC